MYSVRTIAMTAAMTLVFLFFVGQELDIRRVNPNALASWTPVFLPYFALSLFMILYSATALYRFYRRTKTPPANVLEQTGTRHHLSAASDDAIDMLLWILIFVFLITVVRALNRSDSSTQHAWELFFAPEMIFYAIAIIYFWLVVHGAVRTRAEALFDGNPAMKSYLWVTNPNYADAATKNLQTASSTAQDRHTATPVYAADHYRKRQMFQYNKIVYVLAPRLLPNLWFDFAHIVLILLFKLAIIITAILLFVRIRQIAHVATLLDSSNVTGETATTVLAVDTKHHWEYPIDVHRHILHSLSDWRGRVMPLAVVFIPLFISQGLLTIYAIPQLVIYLCQRRRMGLDDYLTGLAYFVFNVTCIIFAAMLAARVDVGSGEHTSWHNTLVPLYVACFAILLLIGAPALHYSHPPVGSRWGLYV